MADQQRREDADQTGSGGGGFVEDALNRATEGSTGDDPAPPDEPQAAAAMPRRNDAPDEEQ
jgi:hypothetical protein